MYRFTLLCLIVCWSVVGSHGAEHPDVATKPSPVAFAQGGKLKMLYDCRQRPQALLLGGRLYIVYNGDATPTDNNKGKAYPMLITYDPEGRKFSQPVRLSDENSSDHHYSPIIWADEHDCLHVLFGCHKTPGTHLVSKHALGNGPADVVWEQLPPIAPKLSYPTAYRIDGDRELIYYRTDGHTSSWTYRISDDNGRSWYGPANDVTDLDSKGRVDWSSYQTKIPSQDGKHLHVVYTDYDDNKVSPNPQRFYNPRYDQLASNEWKYNLSYVRIDLATDVVRNSDGDVLKTPIDIEYSKANCEIWDTEWRGAGIPPVIALDSKGEPTFLHVLSVDSLATHRYYYVRKENGRWVKTPICESNHQWNSGHLARDEDGTLHAYVIAGEGYLEGGYMDRHGGGRVEEWVSRDGGNQWSRRRDLNSNSKQYADWKFNNVQPVVRPDGSIVEDMLLYYGWKDSNEPDAKAFLFHE